MKVSRCSLLKLLPGLCGIAFLGMPATTWAANVMVDLELSLVVDVSGSVDDTEYQLQAQGYIDAFNNPSIHAGVAAGQQGKIAVNLVQFSNSAQEAVPFTLISTAAEAQAFAAAVGSMARLFSGGTNIESGIAKATESFAANLFDGRRMVIDVSGDGEGADGTARDAALAAGVNAINGVVISDTDGSLKSHYQQFVIGGTGAFVAEALTFTDFGTAVTQKLEREITGGSGTVIIHGRREEKVVHLTDVSAIASATLSGLPVAAVQGPLALGTTKAGVRDVNGRLFRLRARSEMPAEVPAPPEPSAKEPIGSEKNPKNPVETSGSATLEHSPKFEVFGSGDYQSSRHRGGRSAYKSDTFAGSVGFEYSITPHFAIGGAYTYLESDVSLRNDLGDVDLEGHHLSPYASFFWHGFYADALYSYANYEHDISRRSGFGSILHGNPDSNAHIVELNFGYDIKVGGLITGPTAALEYTDGSVDGYEERGASNTRTIVSSQSYESLVTRLGWQLSYPIQTSAGRVTPQIRLSWDRENVAGGDNFSLALAESPFLTVRGNNVSRGSEFKLNGRSPSLERDYLTAGAGVMWEFAKNGRLIVDYEGHLLADKQIDHFAAIKVSWRF